MDKTVDIFIIGGGINGTAIAADASGRGLSVALCEKGDLASGTSSASTKLVHGGLRYLELYEFNLVRKALNEREILMYKAPNLIKPLEFILPYEKHLRSVWLIRLGLFLYDHLSFKNSLPHSRLINFTTDERGNSLLPSFKKGFSYYDCFTDDARLVILNALAAKEKGANILTRTAFISATITDNQWTIILKDLRVNKEIVYRAKVLINVAGPWIQQVQNTIERSDLLPPIKLDKGSHIIIPKLYEGNYAYILQNPDQRIVFTIPFYNDFTLIGTTDITYKKKLDDIHISVDEINYLCRSVNRYFSKSITPSHIIKTYSGIRCLQAEEDKRASKLSRDYKIIFSDINHPPLLTVIGGKLTTHRLLAEKVIDTLKICFPHMGNSWTKQQSLPGCDFSLTCFKNFYKNFCKDFPWLPQKLALRYTENYGHYAYRFLQNVSSIKELGKEFFENVFQKEIEYLIKYEWAEEPEDILWRRSKLGLLCSQENQIALAQWMKEFTSK